MVGESSGIEGFGAHSIGIARLIARVSFITSRSYKDHPEILKALDGMKQALAYIV